MSDFQEVKIEYVNRKIVEDLTALLNRPHAPVGRGLIDRELNRGRDVPKSLLITKALSYMCNEGLVKRCVADNESKFWLSSKTLDEDVKVTWVPGHHNNAVQYQLEALDTQPVDTSVVVQPVERKKLEPVSEKTVEQITPVINTTPPVSISAKRLSVDEAILKAFTPKKVLTYSQVVTLTQRNASSVGVRLGLMSGNKLVKCRLVTGTFGWILPEGFIESEYPEIDYVVDVKRRNKATPPVEVKKTLDKDDTPVTAEPAAQLKNEEDGENPVEESKPEAIQDSHLRILESGVSNFQVEFTDLMVSSVNSLGVLCMSETFKDGSNVKVKLSGKALHSLIEFIKRVEPALLGVGNEDNSK